MQQPEKRPPTLLVILDGWGHAERAKYNAISEANTPTWDALTKDNAFSLLDCSGESVGLPAGQMGNSEVGHMHMGAGRVVHQELTRINAAFAGESKEIDALEQRLATAAKDGRAVHLMGLISPGGVHSHESHFQHVIALGERAGVKRLFVHAFLDGRDTPPRSALASLEAMPGVVSVMGRYYAMDRDNRWQRTRQAYDLLVSGTCDYQAQSAALALSAAYARDESDEFVKPTRLDGFEPISDQDLVIFMNFRADRARQLTQALTEASFNHFPRQSRPRLFALLTMTRYADEIKATPIFDREDLANTLGAVVSNAGRTQLRIAETEKYAHVTYFFSGGREQAFAGEKRILVPSPKVETYDLKPEMSAREVTDELVKVVTAGETDLIVCNFANPDMVGHTGNWHASLKAVACIDACLARITQAVDKVGGQMLITSDHGNIEDMLNEDTGQAQTAHTTSCVPLLYIGNKSIQLAGGSLADLAPTLLELMSLPQPAEMTGSSLIR